MEIKSNLKIELYFEDDTCYGITYVKDAKGREIKVRRTVKDTNKKNPIGLECLRQLIEDINSLDVNLNRVI